MATVPSGTTLRQYSLTGILALWTAAALPMGLMAWVVAPSIAGPHASDRRFFITLLAAMTIGLAFQFILVIALVAVEQRSLNWQAWRDALRLRGPSDATGQSSRRAWWWIPALVVGDGLLQLLPLTFSAPARRNLGHFLASPEGHDTMSGNWGLFALAVLMLVFNTVLGEELFFRGLLLPRMQGVFGRKDWIANGILAGLYHLHQPWSIPRSLVGHTLLYAYPARRFRSTWFGIAAHSAASAFILVMLLALVID
ncbi:CPBP family intramembrane glutamic endopeptidase [Streptomyces sp. NPDC056470]|uniref:CPBP family intramembrane glutamic endopeptidase n=1 Tax=Streptomyces sp. NPDC056470 TaxID=3345831 RepID=UPI0036D1D396